jgi:NADH-quinone oxidoreductase subunit A
MENLFGIALYGALIMSVAVGGLVFSMLVGKRRRGVIKEEPYECGVPQIGETRSEFNVRFFLLAMMFILFDIETVLLAPYAVTFIDDIQAGKGLEYLVVASVFIGALGFGLLYEWRKGVLDWNVPLGQSPDKAVRNVLGASKEESTGE